MCRAVQLSRASVGINSIDGALRSLNTLSLFFDVLLHSLSSKVGYLRSRWDPIKLFGSGIDITLCHSFYVYVLCDGQFS